MVKNPKYKKKLYHVFITKKGRWIHDLFKIHKIHDTFAKIQDFAVQEKIQDIIGNTGLLRTP